MERPANMTLFSLYLTLEGRKTAATKNISEWGLWMLTHAHAGRRAIKDAPRKYP